MREEEEKEKKKNVTEKKHDYQVEDFLSHSVSRSTQMMMMMVVVIQRSEKEPFYQVEDGEEFEICAGTTQVDLEVRSETL